MKYGNSKPSGYWKNLMKPQHMGFRLTSEGAHKTERWMWHREGKDWSMTIHIPTWKASLFRFMHDSPPPQIEFPVEVHFTSPGGSGSVKLEDNHEMTSALSALEDPMVLMAGATSVARRMLAQLR